MITSFIRVRRHFQSASKYRLETGFSMLEAVVVVGVLLALAIGGFFAYGPITENAKIAKVRSAASEVHTGVLVASMDGNSDTSPEKVIEDWNGSTNKIRVALVDSQGGNGDFCVSAANVASPHITHQTGSCVPGSGSVTPGDLDSDGIPDASDPDRDGDAIPNESDSTPDGENVSNPGGSGGGTTPVSTKCTNLSVTEEAVCWLNVITDEEMSYMDTKGLYFGKAWSEDYQDVAYDGNALDGIPLMHLEKVANDTSSGPEWAYGDGYFYVIDRDGELWKEDIFKYVNQPGDTWRRGIRDSGENLHYNCNFLTPSEMLTDVCEVAGIPEGRNRIKYADNDATADADVQKVLDAQLAHSSSGQRLFYGGAYEPTDVTAWAGTTYSAKVWNEQDLTATSGQQIYTTVQVTAPNGDIYTANLYQWTGMEAPSNLDHMSIYTYRYSGAKVVEICTRPYLDKAHQEGDIKQCEMQGYMDFGPAS